MSLSRWSFLLPLVVSVAACAAPADDANEGEGEGQADAITSATPLFVDQIGPEKTRFPIILEHGFASSAQPASIWRFASVAEDLKAQGHPLIVAADVEPFNGVVARAKSMEKNLRALAEKCKVTPSCDPSGVHVIAHSFGGLHAREYLRQHPPSKAAAEGLPRVVSLTTVATPNRGSNIADFGLGLIEAFKKHPKFDAFFEGEVNKIASVVGRTFSKDELVSDPRVAEALHDLSEANADAFAASHPAVPGVKYYAWAGVSVAPQPILHPFHPERVTEKMPANCGKPLTVDNRAYATDLLLLAPQAITGHFFSQIPNDGMSTVESAKALPGSRFMGCIPADHLADVGFYSTDNKKTWTGFDHTNFYRYMASVLAKDEND